ncbi:MAG: LPS assembly protein LptD [Rhodospirillales bacterium]|nr:LPS assembly protein LptD [Rhodospirillales bacterium]
MIRTLAPLVLACLLALSAFEAGAQQTEPASRVGDVLTGDLLMTADELVYDEATDSVVASGNVEVAQGERVLRAERIRYRQSDGVVTASGNVALREPTGEVLFADSVELTGDLRSGLIHRLSVLMTDNSRIVAGGARRMDGNRTVMRKAVYSPCELCADEPARPPLWQLRSRTVVHDQTDRDLTYYDASLEFFGVPVFYTPYFRHPDPTVTRQSGFLSPIYRSSRALGAEVAIPYYWSFAPHRDLTFSPRFTSDEGVVLAGEYRERTRDGQYTFDASITQANTASEDDRRLRGHVFGHGLFDVDRNWRWGFDVERALDDTYLKRYDISSKDELVTTLYAEQYRQRSFMSGHGYSFQSLRAGEQSDQSPIVLPLLDAKLVTDPDYAGGYATLDSNLMILERLDGTDSRRISVTGGWHRPMILPGGHLFRIDASLRGDLYHTYTRVDGEQPSDATRTDTTARFMPQLAVEWRYPLISRIGSIRQLIEPIVQGVISPDGGNPVEVPNEDSQDLEFDHTNLFSTNRFTGLDRIETGRRVNYGVRLGYFGPEGGRATASFGQSIRDNESALFGPGSGLEHRLSDFVGHVLIQPSPLIDLSLRFRLDHRDASIRRNEIDLAAGPSWLRGRIGFADLDRQTTGTMESVPGGREAFLGFTTKPFDHWTFSSRIRRDVEDNASINWRAGLSYEDECIVINTGLSRSFTRDRDIEPDTVWLLSVILKQAG